MYNDKIVNDKNVWYNIINLGRLVMEVKKRKRKASFSKIKLLFVFVVFASITMTLGYNCLSNILKIYDMKNEKKELES